MSDLYLNIGCGRHPLEGFVNIDMEEGADVQHDVTQGLPYEDASVDGIFNEHFLEHLTQGQGVELLRECRRVLKPGAVLRVAMPDLDVPVNRYLSEDWRGDADMFKYGYDWVSNRCEMLNVCMREWGHRWLYNEEELARLARLAGLEVLGRRTREEGADPRLLGLEHRDSSRLIMEFRPVDRPIPDGQTPLVSVLIAAYKPTFFREALDSALIQSYPNIEIIICDDSRDGAIEDMVNTTPDPRVRYVRNEQRLGGRHNYAKCLSLAEGEFVKYLNDDDRLHPDCISRLVECFRRVPRLRLATSRRRLIDASGRVLPDQPFSRPLTQQDSLVEGRSLARLVLGTAVNPIGEPTTTLFRREDALQIHPDPFSFGGQGVRGVGDIALWLNLLSRGDCAYLVDVLSDFRLHDGQRQLEVEVSSACPQSWERLRYHGMRLGLWRGEAPAAPQSSPLARCASRHPEEQAALQDRHTTDPSDGLPVYGKWIAARRPSAADHRLMQERAAAKWSHNPSFHLITVFRGGQEAQLAATVGSLEAQLYPGWGLTVLATVDAPAGLFTDAGNVEWIRTDADNLVAATNRALADTGADWGGLIDPGDQLPLHALSTFADYANIHPEWRAIYCDSDSIDAGGRRDAPRFHPDFNPEMLRSTPYFGNICLVHRATLQRVGGLRALPGVEIYDAVLRLVEACGETSIGHIHDVLFHQAQTNRERYRQPLVYEAARLAVAEHLRRSGLHAEVSPGYLPGTHFIEYHHRTQPLVSIIIPTKDRLDLLKPCVESLLNKTAYPNYEVLVVDNNSTDPAALEYLSTLASGAGPVRVLRYPQAYNFSAINNYAAGEARGEYLLLLNNDTQIVQDSWLDRMMSHGQCPDVGIVGARLVFPNMSLQHAGVILGIGAADHVHIGIPMDEPGYLGRAQLAQNFSAVTAACLLVRRSVYEQAGGLDEECFKVLFNDVDLCLKVLEHGYKVVWTPFATVVHHGSSSINDRTYQQTAPKTTGEAWNMLSKWLPRIANDPAFNRNLSVVHRDVRIETEAIPGWNPDFRDRPRIAVFGSDRNGRGPWRIQPPVKALETTARVQSLIMPADGSQRPFELSELASLGPDVLVVCGELDDLEIKILELYRRFFPHLRLVLDLDETMNTGPAEGSRTGEIYEAVGRRLNNALALCDRLIVSTEQARDAHRERINDIVVVPDYLERRPWEGLASGRAQSEKLRVGWAWQPGADLPLLRETVRATADEVEWVFLGNCLPELLEYAHEVHESVDTDRYPAKLAGLNLDLVVTPLGRGVNEREARRRILEYGILGVPVICSEGLARHLGPAPVTFAGDTAAAWIEAIRESAADAASLAHAGDALRDWVENHWLLENHLDEWFAALTGADASARPDEDLRSLSVTAQPSGVQAADPSLRPDQDQTRHQIEIAPMQAVRIQVPQAPAPFTDTADRDDPGTGGGQTGDGQITIGDHPGEGAYPAWCDQHRLTEADAQIMAERMMHDWKHFPAVHLVAVLQPGQEAQMVGTIADLNAQLYQGWGLTIFAPTPCPEAGLQGLDNLEWIEADGDVTDRVNRAVRETGADWVALVEAGDRLEPHLLFACVDHINRHPEWKLVYVDEDTIDASGRRTDPRFKPDFNLDLLRSMPYVGAFCLINRQALERAGGWVERGGLEPYDAALRILETQGERALGHIAEMLYHRHEANRRALLEPPAQEAGRQAVVDHLARSAIPAEVSMGLLPGTYHVAYRHDEQPRVSIIIPTRDRAELLQTCVDSLLAKTTYPDYEILLVDNNSTAADTLACLETLEAKHPNVRILRYPHPYNGAAMRNEATRAATGEYLLFLDDDLVAVQSGWLERMLCHAQRPEVGIVGARLVFTDQGVEHAGLVLGMGSNGAAGRPFSGMPMAEPGVMGRTQVTQNYSAVSGACLLIRRSVFDRVGGLDAERLAVSYHDVDLCLKVRRAGYKTVWTPFATLARFGNVRLQPQPGQSAEGARAELGTVLERWLPLLARDPAYNRHLSLAERTCPPESEIHVPWDPDVQGPPRIMAGGLGYGSLHYRVSEPLKTLGQAARARVALIPGHHDRLRMPSVAELERAAPDVLLLHNGIHEIQLEILKWYRRFNDVFTVFGQDDLIFDVPEDHPLRKQDAGQMEARVRSALAQCDRLVVTTEALADAHRHMIEDIRVVPNYLDRGRWGRLRSERRMGAKPRVGWAGAQQHQGDLKLMIDVVRATAAEVDWVFFGMCPEELLPLVKEFHDGVPYERYPEKLAALNLDIAVAPLAVNRFNECKSNLRLLEYGALGWPVIASDIVPYRNAPVQLVGNEPRPWIEAIMDRARDLDAAAWEGDRLREWVHAHWMLDHHLDQWLDALLLDAGRSSPAQERKFEALTAQG